MPHHDCETVCLGEILERVCQIGNCFCLLKVVICKHIEKFKELKDDLEGYDSDEYLPCKFRDAYFSIAYHLRKEINSLLARRLDDEVNCIPNCDQAFVLNFGHERICFVVPSFVAMKYLQKTNHCGKLLYFEKHPREKVYDDNKKLTIDDVSGPNVYPCLYYVYGNKITSNYSYIESKIGGTPSCYSIMEYRLLLSDNLEEKGRESVESYGKYKFRYCREESDKVLKDPKHSNHDISTKIQGVDDGLYCFAPTLDFCHEVQCGEKTISNTICILEQLAGYICDFTDEVDDLKEKIVSHAQNSD